MKFENDIFLPSPKIYTEKNPAAFKEEARKHVLKLNPAYGNLNPRNKWEYLINAFGASINIDDLPDYIAKNEALNCLDKTEALSRLNKFKEKRIAAENDDQRAAAEGKERKKYNLTIEQSVNYFEQLFFIYNTDTPGHKLRPEKKQSLIRSLYEDTLPACETGINEQFNNLLQEHQTDNDWILNEMAKARYLTIHLMLANYNNDNPDVHYMKYFIQLANEKQLAIPHEAEINDVYEFLVPTAEIISFFNNHYEFYFKKYESEISTIICNEFIKTFSDFYNIKAEDLWDTNSFVISTAPHNDINLEPNFDDFRKMLTFHFDLEPNEIDALFGQEEDDVRASAVPHIPYFEEGKMGALSADFNSMTLVNKNAFTQIIHELSIKKLIKDDYFISIDKIAANPKENSPIILGSGITVEDLHALYKAIITKDLKKTSELSKKNPLLLIKYPELISLQIENNPKFITLLPPILRFNPEFVSNTLNDLIKAVSKVAPDDEKKKIELTQIILDLVKSDYQYFENVPPSFFKDPTVTKLVIEKFGLVYDLLPESAKNNALLELAIKANPDARYYLTEAEDDNAILNDLNPILNQFKNFFIMYDFDGFYNFADFLEMTPYQKIQCLKQAQALAALLYEDKFSLMQLRSYLKDVSPRIVLNIIQIRKLMHKSPLPFFENLQQHQLLENFLNDVNEKCQPHWKNGPLAIKKQAFGALKAQGGEENQNKNALYFLSSSPNWFDAFCKNNEYNSSNERLQKTIKHGAQQFGALMIILLKIASLFLSSMILCGLLYSLSTYYFLPLLCICAAMQILGLFLNTPTFRSLNSILVFLLIPQVFTALIFGLIIGNLATHLEKGPIFSDIGKGFGAILFSVINLFSSGSELKYLSESVHENCENAILRLEHIGTQSAQEKADILSMILEKAEEYIDEDDENGLKEALNIPFNFDYHGKEYFLSFNDVSAIHRSNNHYFELEPRSQPMLFFSSKTSTRRLIDAIQENLPKMAMPL